jgi:hypothetical protein
MKGGLPVTISYIKIPKVHQSTLKPWPFISRISGAKYSAVPQNDFVVWFGYKNLASPKSANFIYPFSSIKTFSGFKSL